MIPSLFHGHGDRTGQRDLAVRAVLAVRTVRAVLAVVTARATGAGRASRAGVALVALRTLGAVLDEHQRKVRAVDQDGAAERVAAGDDGVGRGGGGGGRGGRRGGNRDGRERDVDRDGRGRRGRRRGGGGGDGRRGGGGVEGLGDQHGADQQTHEGHEGQRPQQPGRHLLRALRRRFGRERQAQILHVGDREVVEAQVLHLVAAAAAGLDADVAVDGGLLGLDRRRLVDDDRAVLAVLAVFALLAAVALVALELLGGLVIDLGLLLLFGLLDPIRQQDFGTVGRLLGRLGHDLLHDAGEQLHLELLCRTRPSLGGGRSGLRFALPFYLRLCSRNTPNDHQDRTGLVSVVDLRPGLDILRFCLPQTVPPCEG